MSVISQAQIGLKEEVTYGTALTVDRFYEFVSEGVKLESQRIESSALRSATRVLRSDRFRINRKGASGDLEMEVQTKGFGLLFKHMLGSIATAGPTDSKYTHTATVGTLLGKSLTFQSNRPFHPAETDQAFTYAGGKVTSWELSNSVDNLLMLKLGLDFQSETTATALASVSYPTSTQLFSFTDGAVTIGGTSVPVTDISIKCDNGLKTDRYFVAGTGNKSEPVEGKMREITFDMTADFSNLTQYNRFAATVESNAVAQIIATWTGPTLIGTSSYPTVVVTLPAARFDGETPTVTGSDPLQIKLSGKVLFDGSNSPVTIAYGTSDATP